jgi:transposase
MFLPTYSPDLNSIEHFWFKIKNHVKKIKNEFENFIDAICYVLKKDTISMI